MRCCCVTFTFEIPAAQCPAGSVWPTMFNFLINVFLGEIVCFVGPIDGRPLFDRRPVLESLKEGISRGVFVANCPKYGKYLIDDAAEGRACPNLP